MSTVLMRHQLMKLTGFGLPLVEDLMNDLEVAGLAIVVPTPNHSREPAWNFPAGPPKTLEEFSEMVSAARAAKRLNPPFSGFLGGQTLDQLAASNFGISRFAGESDTELRKRLSAHLRNPATLRGKAAGVP